MKIIGIAGDRWRPTYIASVDHDELAATFDKRHGDTKLPELKAGDEIDLKAGYDFREDIQSACRGMADAMKRFEAARDTLLKFTQLVAAQEPPATHPQHQPESPA